MSAPDDLSLAVVPSRAPETPSGVPDKRKLTIKLRPIVMASIDMLAAEWGMPADEWLETMLTQARMMPGGVLIKLTPAPVEPPPMVDGELPLGPIGNTNI